MTTTRRKPRIAYVLTPITFGGAEKVNLNFLKHADRERFIIEPILFLRPWEEKTVFQRELERHGYDYHVIPIAKTTARERFRVARCCLDLFALLKRKSYDLIHTHGYLADLLAFPAAKFLGMPIISTCHGFIYQDRKLSLYIRLDFLALRSFNRVIAVSEGIRGELEKEKVPGERIVLIENVTPVAAGEPGGQTGQSVRIRAGIRDDQVMIGYVGRLSEEKGVNFLIDAMAAIVTTCSGVMLVVIGDGHQRDHLAALVDRYHLRDHVLFTGFQSSVDEWFRSMDIMVLPSLTEGTPMVLLEAMAHGIPCVASAVGGIPRIMEPGVDGLLVSPGKPEEIAAAVCTLLADSSLRGRIGAGAKNKVARLGDMAQWTGRIQDQYLQLLDMRVDAETATPPATKGKPVRECLER